MPQTYRAAWVPDDDPERERDDALALGARWIDRAGGEPSAEPVLITDTRRSISPAVDQLAERYQHVTPHASHHLPPGAAPVLAYVPSLKALESAIRLAQGSPLAVVESVAHPMRGWALQVGALDLTRPHDAPVTMDARTADALSRLRTYSGNAFAPASDRRDAEAVLRQLDAEGLLDRDLVCGAMTAMELSGHAVKKLAKLIDSLER